MSQYTLEYRVINATDAWLAADILYSQHPMIRDQHPWPHYRTLLTNELVGITGLLCYCDGFLVGALALGELAEDYHIAGKGIIVYASMTHKLYPKATRLLYRYLTQIVKDGGGSWYQTTRRVSEFEFHSKYRRVPHG